MLSIILALTKNSTRSALEQCFDSLIKITLSTSINLSVKPDTNHGLEQN